MTQVSDVGKLAGSSVVLVLRKVACSGLSAISSVVVVRHLSPDHFGQYVAGLSAFYLFLALTEFGFGEVLGRALGRDQVDPAAYGRLVLRVNLVWSGLVALAGVVVAALFAFDSIRGGTLLVMTPALALAGTTALRQFFYARHEVGRMARLDLSTAVLSTVVIVGLALAGAPAVLLAAAASAASVLNCLAVLRVTRPWISPGATAPTMRPAGLIREAFPIGFASFLATAYVSIDVVILSTIFPAADLGQYAGAVKVLSILTIFPGLVMAAALPHLSADWHDPARTRVVLTRVWHWFMALVMPGLVIVSVHATGVMTVLFGADYAPAGAYLRILAVAGLVAMLAQLLGVVVVAAAKARRLVVQNLIALVMNVGGNLIIAPRYGIAASAWLTVATEVIVCAGSWSILRHRIPYAGMLRAGLLPLVAIAAAVPLGLVFAASPWVALSLSGVAYLVILAALRGWPAELVTMAPRLARPM